MILKQSCKSISLVTALFLAGATALAQQQGAGQDMQQQVPQTTQQPTGGQAGAPGNQMAPGTPSTQTGNQTGNQNGIPSYADQAFVRDAFQDNQAQIEISQLAGQKSPSEDVKQFSQQMVKIHTELDTQLEPLAKQLDVSPPKKPSRKEKQEIAKLEALSGPDFDAAYLQAMASAQEHSLKAFKAEETAKNPLMQKVAQMDEPVLTQHFQMLEMLAKAHNVALEDSK